MIPVHEWRLLSNEATRPYRRWCWKCWIITDRRLASGYNHADSRVITNLSAVITRCRDDDIMHRTGN